ncbi:MAG: hypothetical protein E6J42_02075 [Chloroflexi bacterium]|nr:MAG: hypothetical protein E6J42_02075 [Chloroflexota bacterium]
MRSRRSLLDPAAASALRTWRPPPRATATGRRAPPTLCIGYNSDCTVRDNPVTDSNFGGIVSFTPPQWTVPQATDVPIGALAGRLVADRTLGVMNNPCKDSVPLGFSLLTASVDTSDTIAPLSLGLIHLMTPLAADANANGIPDGADKYPTFLNTVFQNAQPRARLFGISKVFGLWVAVNLVFFEPGTPLASGATQLQFDPALGYPEVSIIQDPTSPSAPSPISDFCAPFLAQTTVLGKTEDNPCSPTPVSGANCPNSGVTRQNSDYPFFPCDTGNFADEDGDGAINDGCPQVGAHAESGAECQNNISDDNEDSDVNDGCPQVGDVSEGSRLPGACSAPDEGGCTYRANPATANAYAFGAFLASLRDADGDGIENQLDVCATIPNANWNGHQRDLTLDTDDDGLPDACDPNPTQVSPGSPYVCLTGYLGPDEDGDCFSNRQDNCPLVNQLVNNIPTATDSDGDGIGDACDPTPSTPSGTAATVCALLPLYVGANGSEAPQFGGCSGFLAAALGDVDCNGAVNSGDALKVLRTVSGLPAVAPCINKGNVDCNAQLNSADALIILRYISGLIATLPVPCNVTAVDNAFQPTQFTISAGTTVNFSIKNNGAATHSFRIAGADMQFDTADDAVSTPASITAGGTGSVAWQAPASAASIPFRCDFHPTEMTGTITVH